MLCITISNALKTPVPSRPQDKFPEVARSPPTPSPSADEIAELKKDIERAIQMTLRLPTAPTPPLPNPFAQPPPENPAVPIAYSIPPPPLLPTAAPHEAGDNSGVATSRVPKVAQPNQDTSIFRPRWTNVRDEFEQLGVLPPPPPEPFLGHLNVNNGDISSNQVTSRPIPITNSGKITRAFDDSLGASPILRDNHNAPGPSSVAPANGHRLAQSSYAVHTQYSPPVASLTETSALGAIPKSAWIPHEAGENSGVATSRVAKVAQPNADTSIFRPRWTSVRDEFEQRIPPPEPSALPTRKFQPLRRPAPSIKISHYCHTCKQDVGTVNANMTCPLCFGTFVERSETVERQTEDPMPMDGSTTATWWPPCDPAEITMQKQLYDVVKSRYYCYECKSMVKFVDPTIWEIVNLRCPKCNSTFIEESSTAHLWFDKEEAETVERNEGYVDQTLALLTAQPVASGEGGGFAWVPPERNMQAFLSEEDKFKMWEVNNKYTPLEDAERLDNEFPDLPPPSLPAYGAVKPKARKPRSLSCGTTRESTDEDDDDDAWEKVGNERHPNRVSRLEKRR